MTRPGGNASNNRAQAGLQREEPPELRTHHFVLDEEGVVTERRVEPCRGVAIEAAWSVPCDLILTCDCEESIAWDAEHQGRHGELAERVDHTSTATTDIVRVHRLY